MNHQLLGVLLHSRLPVLVGVGPLVSLPLAPLRQRYPAP
jgi:hypothetical protein